MKIEKPQDDKNQVLILNMRPNNNQFDFNELFDKHKNITRIGIYGLSDGIQFKNVQSLSKYQNFNEICINVYRYRYLLDQIPNPEKIEKLKITHDNNTNCDFLLKYINLKELTIEVLVPATELTSILSNINSSLDKLTLEFCNGHSSFDMKDLGIVKSIKELVIKPHFSSDKTTPPLHNCDFLKILGIHNIFICGKSVDNYEIELNRYKILAEKTSSRTISRLHKISKIKNKTIHYGGASRCHSCESMFDSTNNKLCYRCDGMECDFINCIICSTQVKLNETGIEKACGICNTKYKLSSNKRYEIKIGKVKANVNYCNKCDNLYLGDLFQCPSCNQQKIIRCALCNVCNVCNMVDENMIYMCALCKTEHHLFEDGTFDILDKYGRVIY